MKYLLLSLIILRPAFGFIPPVPVICDEVIRGRKDNFGTEIILKHQVAIRGNQLVEIDEKILIHSGQFFFTFTPRSEGQPIKGEFKNGTYSLSGGKNFTPKSRIILTYLAADKGEDLQNSLLREQFVRRDQLLRLKPGVKIEGDPKAWNLKENYLKHSDIFLSRLPIGPAITVQGTSEGGSVRSVSFRKDLLGLARLEWEDSEKKIFWDFVGVKKEDAAGGSYPKRMSFNLYGNNVVNTDLISVRPLNQKNWSAALDGWKKTASQGGMSGEAETALTLLLSYR